MRIASWNVNSLRVRLPHVLDWLAEHKPDVLGIQETKLPDDAFPSEALAEAGYQAVYTGQKTYNGVALLSRSPARDVVRDLEDYEDPQRRVVGGTVNGVRVLNLYVPNGQAVGSDKYEYKLGWLGALRKHLAAELAGHSRLVVMGDFNIAPEDRDVHDPEEWRDKILCSGPEREALGRLLELELVDTFRLFDQPEAVFSWWDYRAAGFRRNRGLRIDLLLASAAMAECCIASAVDVAPRRLERPSDHAPVFADFELPGD
ncbi:MAG: exodeoxyribonuclease III [Gammaproteobacteria bacterium]